MADTEPARCPFCEARPGQAVTATEAQAETHRAHKATVACIRCGGTEDLMDRAMAPGMTYCAPCRRALREGG